MNELDSIEEVKKIISNNPMTLLYFYSNECEVCLAQLPKIENILASHKKIKSIKIDAAKLPMVVSEYSVLTVPTLLFYIDGIEFIREARFISLATLDNKIERLYNLKLD